MRKKVKSKVSGRLLRINDEIMRVCANILHQEIKDPRVSSMVSVTKADTSRDLSYCKIYISVFGDSDAKKDALTGLKNAAGFIRSAIADKINLRNTPELSFVLDDTLEYGARLSKLIDEADKGEWTEDEE